MSRPVISIENVSKAYQLGVIDTGTFRGDLQRWWARSQGLSDPFLKIGEPDRRKDMGEIMWALKDVSFQLQQGEAVGIIGRNGAGKSTLLKILSRVTAPTSGEIKIKGRIASLLEVGTGFHPELTGRENIYLNGAIFGMTRAEISRKFDEILDFSGVEQFIDTPVKRYSSGMYVRLAFAVAAHLEPEILIVDEVLAVGDAEFQKKCVGKMGNVTDEGRTVLFVSHNMAAIQSLCSRALLFKQGQMVFSDETDSVISKYLEGVHSISQQDLRVRTDRTGNQQFRCTRLNFEDQNGNQVQELASGRDYSIVLGYESDSPLKNVSISIGFYGDFGQFLLLCNNEMAGAPFETLSRRGKIQCKLPRFPFAPGSYYINLYVEVQGVLADWVQEAAAITVIEGDFFGTGKSTPNKRGGFLANQIWMQISEK